MLLFFLYRLPLSLSFSLPLWFTGKSRHFGFDEKRKWKEWWKKVEFPPKNFVVIRIMWNSNSHRGHAIPLFISNQKANVTYIYIYRVGSIHGQTYTQKPNSKINPGFHTHLLLDVRWCTFIFSFVFLIPKYLNAAYPAVYGQFPQVIPQPLAAVAPSQREGKFHIKSNAQNKIGQTSNSQTHRHATIHTLYTYAEAGSIVDSINPSENEYTNEKTQNVSFISNVSTHFHFRLIFCRILLFAN